MRSFRRLCLSTLIAVYILILVGGVVRSTGSGMGCPDWPKCFGSWVPPTDVSELPENYKEIYAAYRDKKNQRFAKYLTTFGFDETASKILTNPQVLHENDFNATKTWIEYINRVVGVIIGLLIFALFIFSIRLWNKERKLTMASFATLILVGFQGWFGSFVVSSNLTAWTITVHMFLALVIVGILIYLFKESNYGQNITIASTYGWVLACMAALLIQIFFGTQVREGIDRVALTFERESWIDNLGRDFVIHRTFSWIVLILHVILILKLRKTEAAKIFALALIMLLLGTVLAGVAMSYFAVPAFLQPIHLLLATVTFGILFMLILRVNIRSESVLNN
ncbi:MAG TPA: COX15/CtaA family protein [Chryseolinea sp.]|mgnify:CR=1 FL=1|nr:COX15/CtaA family protein [Flavobacteriales bacterium]HPM32204.1 COX15/CtaA family protein [Chryseolinea sp.]